MNKATKKVLKDNASKILEALELGCKTFKEDHEKYLKEDKKFKGSKEEKLLTSEFKKTEEAVKKAKDFVNDLNQIL